MKKIIFTLLFIHSASSLAMCNLEALPLISKTPASSEKRKYFSTNELEKLKSAAQAKDYTQIEQALGRFPVNQFLDENKTTLLIVAVTQENFEMVQLLLQQHGADPNIRNLAGWSPLMMAARRGTAGIAKLLVAYGANKDALNPWRKKPYQIAKYNGYPELAKELKPQCEWFFKTLKALCP